MTKQQMIDHIYYEEPFEKGSYRGEIDGKTYRVYSKDVLVLVIGDFITSKLHKPHLKSCSWNVKPWFINMQYFSTVCSSLQNLLYSCEYKGICKVIFDTEEEFLTAVEEEL